MVSPATELQFESTAADSPVCTQSALLNSDDRVCVNSSLYVAFLFPDGQDIPHGGEAECTGLLGRGVN